MRNYFEYFTEIEQRFQQRRGTLLMLSTLDWGLIDTWREAGVPLQAVLTGIDDAFEKREAKRSSARGRLRKVNGLAWCAQSVLEAAERLSEAAVGMEKRAADTSAISPAESGFEARRVAAYLESNATKLRAADLPGTAHAVVAEAAERLHTLADTVSAGEDTSLEELDATLSGLESRLVAALVTATPEEALLALREEVARELAPYRGRMPAVQARQVQQQMLEKRLLQQHGLPRLSLFYMSHE